MLYRFTLTYNSVETSVTQPQGWTDFRSELKRDFKSHGVMFRFTSGTLKLGFADGRDILESAFQLEGLDAQVTFTADKRADQFATWTNLFTGNAVMKNRELSESYFEVDFEGSTFQQRVINRLKTKIKLDATEDLDGNTLTGAFPSYTGDWNEIRLRRNYEANYKVGADSTQYEEFIKGTGSFAASEQDQNLMPYFIGVIDEELLQYNPQDDVFSNGTLPLSNAKHQLTPDQNGDVRITGTIKFYYAYNLSSDGAAGTVEWRWIIRVVSSINVLLSEDDLSFDSDSESSFPIAANTGVITVELDTTVVNTSAGDKVYVFFEPKAIVSGATTSSLSSTVRIYHNSIYQLSSLKEGSVISDVKSWFAYDVIKRGVEIVTGNSDGIYSDFFGNTENGYASDGCGALTHFNNGLQLRGIDTAMSTSLSDILSSLYAVYGIGYSFQKEYDDTYKMRIEPMEFFYGDGEILDLGSPVSIKKKDSYKESIYEPLIFNEVEIGYSKFSDDEDYKGNLDDFSAKSSYSLPIRTVSGKYSQVSKFIASGRLVQATFESRIDLTKTWKYDSNIFIVRMSRSGGAIIPENDENFESVGGVDDPTTAYSIRIAPIYNELNHALIVNSVLMGKSLNDVIVNTDTLLNQDFNATFDQYEACLLGDSQRLQRSSVGNISIGDNFEGKRLFDPIKHEVTIAMTTAQLNTLIDALENNADDSSVNYGYLTYRDNEGAVQSGYPLNIVWNPIEEIADITTLERADNYGL